MHAPSQPRPAASQGLQPSCRDMAVLRLATNEA